MLHLFRILRFGNVLNCNRHTPCPGRIQFCRSVYSLVCVTTPDEKLAHYLAQEMLKKNMIACANIIPKVTSIYVWKGDICEDQEVFMFIKTRTTSVGDVVAFVEQNHPYEVSEVISIPISTGNRKYLNWIGEVVKPK